MRASVSPVVRALGLALLLSGCARPPGATEGKGSPSTPAASASAPVTHSAAIDPRTRGWALGQEYPYQLKLGTAVSLGAQSNVLDFDLEGEVLVVPTAETDGVTTLFVGIRNAKLVSRLTEKQEELQKVAAQASATGCLVTLSGGLVTELHFAKDLSPLTVGVYREVASRLQFAHAREPSARYQAEEYDTTGKYLAEYLLEPGASGRYRKRKVHYSSSLGSSSASPLMATKVVPQVGESAAEITLAPDGRPIAVRARDEVVIKGTQNPVKSKTSVSLVAGSSVRGVPRDWAAVAAGLTRVAVDEPYAFKVPVGALDASRIQGLTYDEIVKRLLAQAGKHDAAASGRANTAQAQQNLEESAALFTALAATFRQKPDTIASAVTAIRKRSPIAPTLLDALGSSGSPQAHQSLAVLTKSKELDAKLRSRALTALARTPEPGPASIAALKDILVTEPFSADALYGLGTYARRLRDAGQGADAAPIAELLGDRLRMAENITPRLLVALGALMNCGCDQTLPQVLPYLTDGRPSVRAGAVRALQSMKDAKVDELIASRLESDTASEVRIAAMDAARVREPSDSVVRVLTGTAKNAEDPRVRYRAVELVVQWLAKRAELRSSLAEIAAKDPEPKVRERARAAL
jgi:hypothetical protein